MSDHLIWLSDCDREMADVVGGKCANLGELHRVGARVPTGFAVGAEALATFLKVSDLESRIERRVQQLDVSDVQSVGAASEEVSSLILETKIPQELENEIEEAYEKLCEEEGVADIPVAVRSSALAEDLDEASFAGQLQTFLWIRGADEVLRHVVRCWAGFFTPEALAYRAKVGLGDGEIAMAVAVQHMVNASSSGVMFTLNPINGDRSKIAIDSAWGLGEVVVSGEVTPDHFLIDKVTFDVLQRSINPKEYELVFDEVEGGIKGREVGEPRSIEPSVSDEELQELAGIGKQIERHYGRPQDIEWAIERRGDESVVHLLQSRAETVWGETGKGKASGSAGGGSKSATEQVLSDMIRRVGAPQVLSDEDKERKEKGA